MEIPGDKGAKYSIEVKIRENKTVKKEKRLIYRSLPLRYRIRSFQHLINDLEMYDDIDLSTIRKHLYGSILYPDISVTYNRYRFYDICNKFRLNIDRNISVKRWSGFKQLLAEYRIPFNILELKGNDEKDFIIPNSISLQILPLSKYKCGTGQFYI